MLTGDASDSLPTQLLRRKQGKTEKITLSSKDLTTCFTRSINKKKYDQNDIGYFANVDQAFKQTGNKTLRPRTSEIRHNSADGKKYRHTALVYEHQQMPRTSLSGIHFSRHNRSLFTRPYIQETAI